MIKNLLSIFRSSSSAVIFALYFSSGLPLALTAATLSAWLAEAKIDIATIGLFALTATPYTLKFLWSPVMDGLSAPFLTRRKGWIITTQIALATSLIILAFAHPEINPFITAIAAIFVAFCSASQDIVIDAYRVEILPPEQQGTGVALAQLGYRAGMIISGAGALYLATYIGWQNTYLVMSSLVGVGMIATLFAKEPNYIIDKPVVNFRDWVKNSVIAPFINFMEHQNWALILIFILAFRLADAFIGIVTNPFLLAIGFSKIEIANIVKIFGVVATLIGIVIGGELTVKYGAIRILFISGFLHALTNLCYVLQASIGHDLTILAISVSIENITAGISGAAFVVFVSNLCSIRYTATQYALLSSIASFGRAWLSSPAGEAVKILGWKWFFVLAAMLAIPGLLILWLLNKRLK